MVNMWFFAENLFLDALIKVLLDPLHPKIKFSSMQRITIEDFLTQYYPLYPLHLHFSNSKLQSWKWNGVFALQIFKSAITATMAKNVKYCILLKAITL